MKIWKVAAALTLAVVLALGVALPGLAAAGETVSVAGDCQPRMLRGEVLRIDEAGQTSFVIQSGEEELAIFVDGNTRYFIPRPSGQLLTLTQNRLALQQQNQERVSSAVTAVPMKVREVWRPFGEKAGFKDIAIGDKVMVWLSLETDGYLARVVGIIKPATYACVRGTITDISPAGRTITLEPVDGSGAVTLNYNGRTVFILNGIIEVEVGQFASAGYDTGTMIARVVRVWPEASQLVE
ncbi:hypothetical protein ACFLS8_00315 [Chloroflexota bacterium]